jgi:formylglycine-generating enzyme required for sulfatase activity
MSETAESRHVFLSYGREDSEIMRRLRDDLRAGGLTVWTDENLQPGTPSWKDAIEGAIEQAGALVVILSPDAKKSVWVERELGYARNQEVRIFPVLACGDSRKAIPLELVSAQWVDLRSEADYASGVQRLIGAIAEHLRLGPHAPLPEPELHRIVHKDKTYIYIPAGPFTMGSSPRRVQELIAMDNSDVYSAEAPQHEVSLQGFYMARYPVTNVEYQVFLHATGRPVPFRDDDWSRPFSWDPDTRTYPEGKGEHPVVLVSWHDAQAYCDWLGGHLPTEAEWEKAARGTDGREWPWGNTWQTGRCNTEESGIQGTTPVSQFAPKGDSPYGVSDMAGNTWEWCSSLLRPYPYRADDGREDMNVAGPRVLRGGALGMERWVARCAFRNSTNAGDYGFTIGFRVVLVDLPESQAGTQDAR